MKIFEKKTKKQKRSVPLPIGHKWVKEYIFYRLTYNCTRCNQVIYKHYPFKDDRRYFWINKNCILEPSYIPYFGLKEKENIFIKPCYSVLMDEALR